MNTILAIDQSTSATKALAYDIRGQLLDKSAIEHRQIYPQPGWVEHDAEEIWNNTLQAIRQIKCDDPICLSITNQRETIVVFDRATGKPLHHAIVWQCRRRTQICTELNHAGHAEQVAKKTGLRIDPYFSASKLAWLVRNRPDIAKKLKDGEALIGTIDTYLIYRFTTGKVFATDHTNASRTLLFDISALRWDEQLCGMFDVPMRALPEVRDSTGEFGETDAGGILKRSDPHSRRDGGFAGVAVCPSMLFAGDGQGDDRQRIIRAAQRRPAASCRWRRGGFDDRLDAPRHCDILI